MPRLICDCCISSIQLGTKHRSDSFLSLYGQFGRQVHGEWEQICHVNEATVLLSLYEDKMAENWTLILARYELMSWYPILDKQAQPVKWHSGRKGKKHDDQALHTITRTKRIAFIQETLSSLFLLCNLKATSVLYYIVVNSVFGSSKDEAVVLYAFLW